MGGKRVQMLPTTKDEDRLAKSLEERAPDRVYILYNKDPLGMHDSLNDDVTENVRQLVDEKTMCYQRDEVEEVGIDFYRFDEALVDVFKLVYMESKRENDVLVNVSGGTKPVAIALAYACSLVENGQPLYYVAEKYPEDKTQADASSTGVVDTSFEVSPLQDLDFSEILPSKDDTGKKRLLIQLLDADEWMGVKDLLAKDGVIAEDKPDDKEAAEERESILHSHYSHAGDLFDDNIVDKNGSDYKLTDSGKLIARLVQARAEIENELPE